MGLKFRRFKAKFKGKTKEPPPEVVCLRYHIHSEFKESLESPPATSSKLKTEIGTNEVIKEKKSVVKPAVQSLFENSNLTVSEVKAETKDKINNAESKDSIVKTNEKSIEPESLPAPPPKGILKKPTFEENLVEEINGNKNTDILEDKDSEDKDDLKKSALIFMTENHDYNEEIGVKSEGKQNTEASDELEQSIIIKKTNDINEVKENNEETVELRKASDKIEYPLNTEQNEYKQESNREQEVNTQSSTDLEQDTKTVRWRETVIEIKPNIQFDADIKETSFIEAEDNSTADFKVHIVKHSTTKELEDSESESEDDTDKPDTTYYRSRGAYSSQAASIFFNGEDPEPAPRVRNVTEDVDMNIKP